MQSNWKGIFALERVDGVYSTTKYAGCALAHLNAIEQGLKDQDYCIVLEDDVSPLNLTAEKFNAFLESISHLFSSLDGVSLCPLFDRDVMKLDYFYTTESELLIINPHLELIRGTGFMIYTRRILAKLQEYKTHLQRDYLLIPNDRLFCNAHYGFFSYHPLEVGIPTEYFAQLNDDALVSDNFGGGVWSMKNTQNLSLLAHQSLLAQHPFVSTHTHLRIKIKLVWKWCLALVLVLVCCMFNSMGSVQP